MHIVLGHTVKNTEHVIGTAVYSHLFEKWDKSFAYFGQSRPSSGEQFIYPEGIQAFTVLVVFLLYYDKIFTKIIILGVWMFYHYKLFFYDWKLKVSVLSWVCKFLYFEDGLDCPKYLGTNLNIVLLLILCYIAYILTYVLTPWSRILLEKRLVLSWSTNSPYFMKPKGLLLQS